MPARLKFRGIILLVVIVMAAIILSCHQSNAPSPVSLDYLGNGIFSFTNHSSKTQLADWIVEDRRGTDWIPNQAVRAFHAVRLTPNTGDVRPIFGRQSLAPGVHRGPYIAFPTNTWRLTGTTSEALTGSDSVFEAVKSELRSFFDPHTRWIPMGSLFTTNRVWFGNPRMFVSEEVAP